MSLSPQDGGMLFLFCLILAMPAEHLLNLLPGCPLHQGNTAVVERPMGLIVLEPRGTLWRAREGLLILMHRSFYNGLKILVFG
jgi:hypothetical protein